MHRAGLFAWGFTLAPVLMQVYWCLDLMLRPAWYMPFGALWVPLLAVVNGIPFVLPPYLYPIPLDELARGEGDIAATARFYRRELRMHRSYVRGALLVGAAVLNILLLLLFHSAHEALESLYVATA